MLPDPRTSGKKDTIRAFLYTFLDDPTWRYKPFTIIFVMINRITCSTYALSHIFTEKTGNFGDID